MKKIVHLYSLLFLLMINAIVNGQNTKSKFAALDVFELEYASDPQISPDGEVVIYVRNSMDIMNDGKRSSLWVINTDGTNHRKLTTRENMESSPRWSPDGSKIVFISATDEGAEIYVYWYKEGKYAKLSQLPKSPSGLSWSPDSRKIAFSMLVPEKPIVLVKAPPKPKGAKWAEKPRVTTRLKHESDGVGYVEPGFSQYFVIPEEGGTPRQITTGEFQHKGRPVWTADSKSLIFSSNRNANWEYETRNSEIYKVNIATSEIQTLTDRNGPDHGPVISPEGKKIAYLGYDDKIQTYQNTNLYIMDIEGGNKKHINLGLDVSISSIKWHHNGQAIYFMYDKHGDTKIASTNLAGKSNVLAEYVGGTVLGRPYGGGSYSVSNSGKLAFTKTSPYRPSDVAVTVKDKLKSKTLTKLNEDLLAHRELGRVMSIWYKSSVDQRDIQGWYVLPPGYNKNKQYPLIVENHGGPISNYGDRFSAEMQLMAAQDYIVFYPNPRGSTGYGEEFANLLFNNYPAEDYNDVMDGVDALIKQDIAHPDSLFVTGGSAGGIMTAWIIGKNNRFRAAAVVKPVMNWISKTLVADNYFYYADYRYEGQPWENVENYMKFSPISLVGNIETPTLVMVGLSDLRTPSSEAKQLYHALKIRKKATALVEIPGAFHNISAKPSQLITKIDHILAWFDKYRNNAE